MKFQLWNRGSRPSSASSASSRNSSGRVEDPSAWLTKELTATFQVFDKDGDGTVSKSELGEVLRSLGDTLSEAELDDVVARLGGAGGSISLEQFLSFHSDDVAGRSSSSSEMEAMKSAFAVFDVDKNGFISAEELHKVMISLGDKHTSLEECRHMIQSVDRDGNQMVDFGEFQCLMSGSSDLSFEYK